VKSLRIIINDLFIVNHWDESLLNEGVNPRWDDGRLFDEFQPALDAVVAGKYGGFWWVSKIDGSRCWEFGLKSNN
jgi:hypothetical protein